MKLRRLNVVLMIALTLAAARSLPAQSPTAFDLIIANGHIIDGTGSPWYSGDVGIRDGKIAAIGNLTTAPRKRTIDAGGKVVAPGFIDMLGQSELSILVEPRLPSKIYQGITTEITGEGGSIAPLNDAIIQLDRRRLRALQDHSRLANLPPVFRAPRKTRHGHQPGKLRRRDAGPPDGARRRQRATHARATRADEGAGARSHERRRGRRFHRARIRSGSVCED